MATQGLVTVLRKGRVVLKIVAGCDGDQAQSLARAIRELNRVPEVEEAYGMAEELGFGSRATLVAVGESESFHHCGEDLSRLYKSTFNQPRFNPRHEEGVADHVQMVHL